VPCFFSVFLNAYFTFFMRPSRKTQIIQTAASLFCDKGYNAVSMRNLADELGIRAASLYNHISSKEEILAHVILEVAKSFSRHINQTFPKEDSALQKLENIIVMHVEITIQKTDALACMNNDWMHLDSIHRNRYIQMREDYEDKFRAIILNGMEKGEIEKRDPEIIVFSLLSTLRTLYLWYAKNRDFDENILKEEVAETLLSGIVK